jgi:hypothetical protein
MKPLLDEWIDKAGPGMEACKDNKRLAAALARVPG